MSESGQSRRFDREPMTSVLPPETDIIRPARLVRALRISLAHGDRIADFEEHQVRAETVLAPNSRLAVFRSSNLFAMVQARFRSSAGEIPAS
jgi:hypothetical protein